MSLLVSNPAVAPAPELAGKADEFISFTVQPQPDDGIPALCRRLAVRLEERAATPLHLFIFGNVSARAATLDALRKVLGRVEWPITWVEGAACHGGPLAGIQVHAFTGDVGRIAFGGRVVGSVFTEGGAWQCFVGGLTPADSTHSRIGQTGLVLENLQTILAQAGFDLADTVRTWFFLENILAWYDDFNQARTKIYAGVKFRSGALPASTGVGAKNPAGAALAVAALAFRPLENKCHAVEVVSPRQCAAPAYGSSFSRALEISAKAGRRLHISGTASLAPGGKTLWAGNVRKQVELTMDAVEAILRSRGFAFADLTRATAYFRHASDAGVFGEWLAANRLTNLPVVAAQCDVCRDDLLFELEAEAEAKCQRPRPGHGRSL